MSNKDNASLSFLFINKSTTSRTLSRSKAEEKADIFRHVQRARQKHDGRRHRHIARLNAPIERLETCWALPNAQVGRPLGEYDGRRRKENSTFEATQPEVKRDGCQASTPRPPAARGEVAVRGAVSFAVTKWNDPAIQRLIGDGFDPFGAFPNMAEYLPATNSCPHPVVEARSRLIDYIWSLDLTEFARKERLDKALVRPTVMFSHLMMVVLEHECANEQLGSSLDRIFGTGALRHVRHEIQNLQNNCPCDLICLVGVLVIRAEVSLVADTSHENYAYHGAPGYGSPRRSKCPPTWLDRHD
jgi:hypothetical protein